MTNELGSTTGVTVTGTPEAPVTEAATTLVEVSPGIAVVFGEVPDGLDLIDLDSIPSFDEARFTSALGTVGILGSAGGAAAEMVLNAKGLYRLAAESQAQFAGEATLMAKDGFKLGTIVKNGTIVGQAKFIPVAAVPPLAIAVVAGTIAVYALKKQVEHVTGLLEDNLALSKETLKTIRREQWSELRALSRTVDTALAESQDLEVVNESVWELISHEASAITQKWELYRDSVSAHVTALGRLDGVPRRRYLETNAEAIVFDTYALLSSLKMYGTYQALRAGRARVRGVSDESEAQLVERITSTTPVEIEGSLAEIRRLTDALVRELRIVAELPGKVTTPLSKLRKADRISTMTGAQILAALEPLVDSLRPTVETPAVPEVVCGPEGIDLDPYLRILRWFLEDGETLRALAFPFTPEARDLAGPVPAILGRRVDATWDALAPGRAGAVVEKFASGTLVAVTDRRILTADPRDLLRRGELEATHRLDDVRYVRPRANLADRVRPTIGISTDRADLQWMFPAEADPASIDALAASLTHGTADETSTIEAQGDHPATPAIDAG